MRQREMPAKWYRVSAEYRWCIFWFERNFRWKCALISFFHLSTPIIYEYDCWRNGRIDEWIRVMTDVVKITQNDYDRDDRIMQYELYKVAFSLWQITYNDRVIIIICVQTNLEGIWKMYMFDQYHCYSALKIWKLLNWFGFLVFTHWPIWERWFSVPLEGCIYNNEANDIMKKREHDWIIIEYFIFFFKFEQLPGIINLYQILSDQVARVSITYSQTWIFFIACEPDIMTHAMIHIYTNTHMHTSKHAQSATTACRPMPPFTVC